nr:unnamed protein product [Callosobruchus chinensis]
MATYFHITNLLHPKFTNYEIVNTALDVAPSISVFQPATVVFSVPMSVSRTCGEAVETAKHVIFDCPALCRRRSSYLEVVQEEGRQPNLKAWGTYNQEWGKDMQSFKFFKIFVK